jgi:hypothetical protein
MFNGEHECLENRIKELKGLPVMHIVIEGSHTFTGIPKPLMFDYKMLSVSDNIYYLNFVAEETFDNPWENEALQRNQILNALHHVGCGNDDVVIISDCDEIPKREAVEWYAKSGIGLMKLEMSDFVLHFNQKRENPIHKAFILRYQDFGNRTPDQIRNEGGTVLHNAGWHFSWLGKMDWILDKFMSFSHQEEAVQKFANREIIAEKMSKGEYLFSDEKCEIVEINYDNLPRHIVDNQSKFKHLFYAG